MYSKNILSRFLKKAGLFFFTNNLIIILVITGCLGLWKQSIPLVYAKESAISASAQESDTSAQESGASVQEPGTSAQEFVQEPIVVVIDPGHGGDNLGGEYEDYTEKEMTMIVANAMKAELEQYEGITVYLTRTQDVGLTLEERCEYAKSVNADFLFCLHFNLSKNHTLFGAETWVSAFGEPYSKGYAFAEIEMELLQDMGLYSRGIKTRLNDEGQDYYGIIRHATAQNLPCVLIEHCHLDQDNDKPFYDHKEKLEAFGRLDAEAVAKYFGLKSESLGKNFENYPVSVIPTPTQTVKPDETKPDISIIDLIEQKKENGEVTIQVSATDYDSGMLYYDYSYDGGVTFSELQRWPDKSKDTFTFTMQIPSGVIPQIVVNVYNGYDLYTTSNMLSLPSVNYEKQDNTSDNPEMDGLTTENGNAEGENPENGNPKDGNPKDGNPGAEHPEGDSFSIEEAVSNSVLLPEKENEIAEPSVGYFMGVCIICAILVFAMLLSMIIILRGYKRRRRRRQHRRRK